MVPVPWYPRQRGGDVEHDRELRRDQTVSVELPEYLQEKIKIFLHCLNTIKDAQAREYRALSFIFF
jgi:hypothetical protein